MVAPTSQVDEHSSMLRRALILPPGFNPKAVALAAQWRAASRNDDEVLARAITFLRQGRYTHTLEPPVLGADSVDEVLFATQAGVCQHFSSGFVFLMRSAGVPARAV